MIGFSSLISLFSFSVQILAGDQTEATTSIVTVNPKPGSSSFFSKINFVLSEPHTKGEMNYCCEYSSFVSVNQFKFVDFNRSVNAQDDRKCKNIILGSFSEHENVDRQICKKCYNFTTGFLNKLQTFSDRCTIITSKDINYILGFGEGEYKLLEVEHDKHYRIHLPITVLSVFQIVLDKYEMKHIDEKSIDLKDYQSDLSNRFIFEICGLKKAEDEDKSKKYLSNPFSFIGNTFAAFHTSETAGSEVEQREDSINS